MKIPTLKTEWKENPLKFFEDLHQHISKQPSAIKIEINVIASILDKITSTFKTNLSFLTDLKIGLDILRSSDLYKHKHFLIKISELFNSPPKLNPEIIKISQKIDYLYQMTQGHLKAWKTTIMLKINKLKKSHRKNPSDPISKSLLKFIEDKQFQQKAQEILEKYYLKQGTPLEKFIYLSSCLEKFSLEKFGKKHFSQEDLLPFIEAIYLTGGYQTVNFLQLWQNIELEEIRNKYKDDDKEKGKKLCWLMAISSPMMLFIKE